MPMNNCQKLFSFQKNSISITTELIPSYRDAELLKSQSHQMLNMLEGHFVLPKQVYFFNHYQGPMYQNDVIAASFPFVRSFSIGKLKKSAADSIPIHLHELTHQVFETTINELYKNQPEISWAFFTRGDMRGEGQSIDFINMTKHLTRFKDVSSKEIHEHFFEISNLAESYNELFADTVPVFFKENPDAIFTNIYFKQIAEQGSKYEVEYQERLRLRSFKDSLPIPTESRGSHEIFFETRVWIWKNIYEDYYLSKNPTMSKSELLFKIFKSIIASLIDITKNFEESGKKIKYIELNQNLIQKLKNEFDIK